MPDHVANRNFIIQALREELVGPAPAGTEIDCTQPISFAEAKESYGPWRTKGSGEEILQRDSPIKRYGIGVLYPTGAVASDRVDDAGPAATGLIVQEPSEGGDGTVPGDPLTQKAAKQIEEIAKRIDLSRKDDNLTDLDLSTTNAYRASSMGVSFLAEFPEGARLVVTGSGGRYQPVRVVVEGRDRLWWVRSPVAVSAEFPADTLLVPKNSMVQPTVFTTDNTDDLDIRVEAISRPYGSDPSLRLLTVCLVNRKEASDRSDESCLFQSFFRATIISPGAPGHILPYPGAPEERLDPEEQSLALLYRHNQMFAVGHGCAADWKSSETGERAEDVTAECQPVFETPSITPDIELNDEVLKVPMAPLAGLVPSNNGFDGLRRVVEHYSRWINTKRLEIGELEPRYRDAATRHMDECARCVERMQDGLSYLESDQTARRAFELANHAILLQQVRSRREPRRVSYDSKNHRLVFSESYSDPTPLNPPPGRGNWRAFQIAFLLMAVKSTAESGAPDRRTVELIWFPTGGGKTEAYFGLSAFSLFMRRLRHQDDAGTHILMRYTLRLLTAQQFQRASGLMAAMEYLRERNTSELGEARFTIGIWVGGDNTPNNREDAIHTLSGLQRGDRSVENKFILGRCPWCGAEMGPLKFREGNRDRIHVLGYERSGPTVVFKCPDPACEFSSRGIPVYVIDEDIYANRPSLLIGTVDKFAMLAWKPDARTLFGIGEDGERRYSPPGLIIQDELHLISGPLGSMVGLYEAAIEQLCTDERGDTPITPKIISSTATIRRYEEQIRALYGREDVALFPPPGLEAGDSFFARYARNPDGSLSHGRMYLGVHAPGLGSLQTVQVRAFTALLQAPMPLTPEERDPWWTLLLFFNSLRELGTTLSLFQSDIPDYIKVLLNRTGMGFGQMRSFWEMLELTGRLRSDEVPEAIAALEVTCTNALGQKPVDVCLASNILEVGIDIDRLSLMAIVGQPKTTSQYIQVSGRVGRKWEERPGLVVTIFAASKPRDRSHFEKFRSYHERLYAQVEPTSVTPFSPPALDRALHAAIVSYVRQASAMEDIREPRPYPASIVSQLRALMLSRVAAIDPAEIENFERVFDARTREWQLWERTRWSASWSDPDIPLLREAGAYADAERTRLSWATPTSMRTVDAECQAQITTLYLQEGD